MDKMTNKEFAEKYAGKICEVDNLLDFDNKIIAVICGYNNSNTNLVIVAFNKNVNDFGWTIPINNNYPNDVFIDNYLVNIIVGGNTCCYWYVNVKNITII